MTTLASLGYNCGMPDHILHLVAILVLLGVANGAPIIARKIFGNRFNAPLDGGARFFDGRPLLGPAKTVRGLVVSVAATVIAAELLGLEWVLGAGVASAALTGDALSSFLKRRLGLKPHSQALALDQIPESLLPLWLLRAPLNLSATDIGILVLVFVVLELLLSRLLYKLHIRDRPY